MAASDQQASMSDIPFGRLDLAFGNLQLEDELDRAQMDIEAGRLSEARLRFTRMARDLRETPRALLLRAKASPSKDSKHLIASLARQSLKTATDARARIQLATALALCGDREHALGALPSSIGLSSALVSARSEAVVILGEDPEKGKDSRNLFQKLIDRWLGF